MRKIFLAFCSLAIIFLLAGSSFAASTKINGVRSYAPSGVVPDNVQFRIVFNNAVVNKNSVGKSLTAENNLFPIEVNPPVNIEGKWQNERTFTARLLSPLRSATTYTATFKAGLKDRKNGNISGTFRFQTEGLSPSDIRASMGRDGNAYFTIDFNLKVDPARLKGFLQVINPQGREAPYNIVGALPSKNIRLSVPVNNLPERQRFTVKIAAGLKSGEGDLGIDKDFSQSVILEPELILEGLYTDENEIRANFNFSIDPETAKSFIEIKPDAKNIAFNSWWNDETIIIRSENFRPRDRFIITFKKGMPSKGGIVLNQDYSQAVIMPDLASEVTLPSNGTYLSALNKGLIPIELRNVKKLQLDLWRMYENNIPYVIRGDYDNFQKDIAKRIFTKEINLDLPLNERVRKSIPIEEISGGEKGLFLLTARDAEKEWWDESSQIINLSDLAATVRLWPDGILVWVNTLTGARGVDDADVKIYSDKKQLLAQGKTNSGGVFYHEISGGWPKDDAPSVAVITKNNDVSFVALTRNLLDREIFDTSGRDWLKTYDGAIISPRDIYRTGEEAEFKAIVRTNAGTSQFVPLNETPEKFPLALIFRDTYGRKVMQENIALNEKGSGLAKITIPANAHTGLWRASLVIPGEEEKPIAEYSFHVEDFAPPRIEVNLNSYRKFLVHNDTFTADIYARWLFGVDGSGLKYKTSWTAREGNFSPTQDRWKGYSFGDPSRKFAFIDGELEESNLDNFGAGHANLPLEDDWQAPTIINVTLRAQVMEDGGRWVTNAITRPYFPAPWLLGIAAASEKMSVRNDLVFKVVGITPEEEPANPGELTAEFFRVTWNYNMIEIDGRKRWQSSEELSKIAEKTLTLKNGMGEVSFKPETYGTYVVRVSDADDNARAVYRFYADDPEFAGSGSQLIDRIEMTTEKDFYKLGETAKIKVKAPFEGLLMINVENAKLITRKIQQVKEPEITFEIPVTQEFRPNAWVSAWLIRPVIEGDAKMWASHRAIGLTKIKTDLSDFNIDIEISAPKKIEPASKLPVTLKLRGSSANIARKADVALALVDDGVLGLTRYKTPDLLNHFWGLKKLNSQGYDIYDQLIPVEDKTTEQLHPAGDAALGALAGDGNVQRFKILSLFEGELSPDENGVVNIELDIPEFSGRGRIFAVAASGRNFGKSEQTIEIARDIVTEAGLPRFAAPSDNFTVPVTIFNTTEQNQNVKITLSPEGLMLSESFKDINIPAGTKANFTTTARALGGAGRASLEVKTSWGSREFSQTIELPVRSAWPAVTAANSAIFEAGTSPVNIPLGDFAPEISGSLSLARTPAVNLSRALAFLSAYPYACLEQTISQAWPFLILPDLVSELDPLALRDDDVARKVDGAIARIQAMQLYDGSFTAYPNSNIPTNWGSVYAAHFLLRASQAGVSYPEQIFTGVLNWIRQYLASLPEYNSTDDEADDLSTKAYAVYVLALNGEKPLGWLAYLRENDAIMRPSGKIFLAGAQSLIDGNADALRNLSVGENSGYSGKTFESDARNMALLLSMWLDVEPSAPEVTELAVKLVELGNNGDWYSTQDNCSAVSALARYNVEVAGAKSEITAIVNTPTSDKALLNFTGKPAAIKISELPKDGNIQIEAQGEGRGYYSWNVTGIPATAPKAQRRNINIECAYYDASGNALDVTRPIPHGSVITVLLTLRPAMTINNLVVNYLLPAGFEIETPRLEDAPEIYSDAYDDRLVLFFDRLAGEKSYGFKVRAVTRGTFRLPQISAFGMYDANVRFTGQVQRDIEIR